MSVWTRTNGGGNDRTSASQSGSRPADHPHQLMVGQWISSRQIYGFHASGHLINHSIDCWATDWSKKKALLLCLATAINYALPECTYLNVANFICCQQNSGALPDSIEPRWSSVAKSSRCRRYPVAPEIYFHSAIYPLLRRNGVSLRCGGFKTKLATKLYSNCTKLVTSLRF